MWVCGRGNVEQGAREFFLTFFPGGEREILGEILKVLGVRKEKLRGRRWGLLGVAWRRDGGGEGVMLGQAGGERSGARGKAGGGNAAVCSHLSSCHRHPSHCCLDHLNQHCH